MRHSQSFGAARDTVRRSGKFLKMAAISLFLLAAATPLSLFAKEAALRLTVVNRSGYSDDQVHFIMICQSPIGYLDFKNHVLVETPSFSLDAATMTATLAQIKEYSGDGTGTIICPAMGSARIYFCFGNNFDQMGTFTLSGPVSGAANTIPWAMFEVNLTGDKFLNQSNVDFFSIAYTLTATKNTGEQTTVGIATPSKTIFNQFESIPTSADSQQSGNTAIFKSLIVRNSTGEIIRVVAPKAAALDDIKANPELPQMFTHYLDEYVNNHCWKPNRTFSFKSKIGTDPNTYYGRISADGLTLSIYTDAAMTVPYAVPTLPRPSNTWGNPNFASTPAKWHNVGVLSTAPNDIDWGYLIYGQDGFASGPGAYWITDPVAMAIPVSIVRGVMHYDNGTVDWKDGTKYYQGLNGSSTTDYPIFYYAKILHQYGLAGKVYALSFDDVYGTDSGVAFSDPNVTLQLYPFHTETPAGKSTGDYDGDGKSDLAIYRNGYWSIYLMTRSLLFYNEGVWGGAGWTPVAGDYDGDGKADLAVYRDGYWSIYSLANGIILNNAGIWGGAGSTPVPGDYDGDGKTDLAVYHNGYWSIYSLANGIILYEAGVWGGAGWTPVSGDFDGDGKSDLAVYNNGYWSIYSLANGIIFYEAGVWGGAGWPPVPGDYDGDGKADLAVYNNGYWSIYSRANGVIFYEAGVWGGAGWVPVQ